MHPWAGKPAPASALIDVDRLRGQYHDDRPDPDVADQRVSFGTSGHRGSAARRSFNDAHVAAIAEAVVEHRTAAGVRGPLFVGADSHALSGPAVRTVVEVLAAHGVEVVLAAGGALVPTPVVSHAILAHNRDASRPRADGIVVTPSHNPPDDGGIKYDPPHGGPADTDVTGGIERRANELLRAVDSIRRIPWERAKAASTTHERDLATPYIDDLRTIVDVDAIRGAKLHLCADPLGGASAGYWEPIAARFGLDITLASADTDPRFARVPVDHDGKVRMDCSSPWAMAALVEQREKYDLAFATDADADRHGIVTRGAGLLSPNAYLAVAIAYLFAHRPGWRSDLAIGKTLVSSALIDRVAKKLGRRLLEVPVGFKWFVPGLADGSLAFGGEESAGASFLRMDGTTWTTDKDGLIMGLLAAEMRARTGRDPGELYADLTAELGAPSYVRIDRPATREEKAALKKLSPDAVKATTLAGDAIVAKLTRAPGNGAEIGGLKVVTDNGWFAARPSGTEDVVKIYAESFRDQAHLDQIVAEASQIVAATK